MAVRPYSPRKLTYGDVRRRTHLPERAGIVERNVETSEQIHSHLYGRLRTVLICNIADESNSVRIRCLELRNKGLKFRFTSCDQHESCPLAREKTRCRVPDS